MRINMLKVCACLALCVMAACVDVQGAMAQLTVANAKVEKVGGGYKFTEGPAADKDGNVYFTDIPNSHVLKFDVKVGTATVIRDKSQRANGLMFDKKGQLYACLGGGRALGILNGKNHEGLKVLANQFGGKKLNSPNDLVLDDFGGVYFSDPRYGSKADMEMKIEGVYYLSKDKKITRVIEDLVKPNGVIMSLDYKTLYVADNGAKTIVAYAVTGEGKLTKKRLFANMDLKGAGGGDGMSIDGKGNVYCAGQGHIWIWDAKGKLVQKIKMPEEPSNCTFGGKDRKMLYITARTSLYRIKMNVAGVK